MITPKSLIEEKLRDQIVLAHNNCEHIFFIWIKGHANITVSIEASYIKPPNHSSFPTTVELWTDGSMSIKGEGTAGYIAYSPNSLEIIHQNTRNFTPLLLPHATEMLGIYLALCWITENEFRGQVYLYSDCQAVLQWIFSFEMITPKSLIEEKLRDQIVLAQVKRRYHAHTSSGSFQVKAFTA